MKSLVDNGANKIWEHNLLDPTTRSNKKYIPKPSPLDSIEKKKNYIEAKYQHRCGIFAVTFSTARILTEYIYQICSLEEELSFWYIMSVKILKALKVISKILNSMYMCKDDDSTDDVNELNAQLFAAARTNELLTSLRLLGRIFKTSITRFLLTRII